MAVAMKDKAPQKVHRSQRIDRCLWVWQVRGEGSVARLGGGSSQFATARGSK